MVAGINERDDDWVARFRALAGLPEDAPGNEKRRRGRDFERVLNSMFEGAGMAPRTSYRPSGEEIYGSFEFRGRVMLLEAKWTKEPMPASSLYQFKGKIDGKLAGTLGLFISMGGYSPEAVDALVAGKSLNLILFDDEDMHAIAAAGGTSLDRAIGIKLRAAAEEGTPLVPVAPSLLIPSAHQRTVFVVEGAYDAEVVNALATRAQMRNTLTIPATGRLNLPLVALAQVAMTPSSKRIVVLADGDGNPRLVRDELEERLRAAAMGPGVTAEVYVLEPNFESVIGLVDNAGRRRPRVQVRELIQNLDLHDLASRNSELCRFLASLGLVEEAYEARERQRSGPN